MANLMCNIQGVEAPCSPEFIAAMRAGSFPDRYIGSGLEYQFLPDADSRARRNEELRMRGDGCFESSPEANPGSHQW